MLPELHHIIIQSESRIISCLFEFRSDKKYFFIFFLAEGLSVAGTVASQKAISLSPGVSLVAAIESLVPLFVMLNSVLVALLLRRHALGVIYAGQADGFVSKAVAIACVTAGIYLVS